MFKMRFSPMTASPTSPMSALSMMLESFLLSTASRAVAARASYEERAATRRGPIVPGGARQDPPRHAPPRTVAREAQNVPPRPAYGQGRKLPLAVTSGETPARKKKPPFGG